MEMTHKPIWTVLNDDARCNIFKFEQILPLVELFYVHYSSQDLYASLQKREGHNLCT